MLPRILIPSGAGSPGFGGIVECLREIPGVFIVAGDIQKYAYGSSLADAFKVSTPGDHPGYISYVMSVLKEFNCNVILPITTRELVVLSENQAALAAAGARLAITPPDQLRIVNNKSRLYEAITELGLECVQFRTVNSREVLLRAAEELGLPEVPVIMKPSDGNGSRGFRIIVSEKDIQNLYFESKQGSLFTSAEAIKCEMPKQFPFDMVVSEYLPGIEWSVDILAVNGSVYCHSIRVREKTVSGISTRGYFVQEESISRQVTALCEVFKLHGPVGMQFKARANGDPVLLEINPRLQGAVSTSRYAGINFPKLAAELSLGQELTPQDGFKDNVGFARYWKDVFIKRS